MNLFDHLNVIVFACLYPAYAFFAYRKIKNDLIENKPGARIRDYKETIFWLWLFCIITIVLWISNDRAFDLWRLDSSFSWIESIATLLFIMTPLLLLWLFRKVKNDNAQRESIKEKLDGDDANEFLPRTKKEFIWFVLLSITAGICEEILFRAYLIWYFEPLGGTIAAIILSSIFFGAAHSYQGIKGAIRAGIIGLFLALIFVWTDSLLIPIFLHIVGDVYNAVIGWLAYGDFERENQVKSV